MLEYITYYPIFGKPLIMYLGIFTLLSLLITASIAILNIRFRIFTIPFYWHPRMAALTILLALIHGILGLLSYL